MSLLLTILLILMVFCGFSPADAAKLRVGYFPNEGYLLRQADGTCIGYSAEHHRKLAAYGGWDVEYVGGNATWSELMEMLKAGEIDVLGPAMATLERRKDYDFPDYPEGYSGALIAARADNDAMQPGNYAAMNGIRAGTIRGTYIRDIFEDFLNEKGIKLQLVEYDMISDLFADLQKGTIALAAADGTCNFKGIKVIEQIGIEPFYIMLRHGNDALKQQLNAAYARLSEAEPNWQSELIVKYRLCRDLTVIVPAPDKNLPVQRQDSFEQYGKEIMTHLANFNSWRLHFIEMDYRDPEILNKQADIIFGLNKNEATFKAYDFTLHRAGHYSMALIRRSDDMRFQSTDPAEWPLVTIAYYKEDTDLRNKLERYAIAKGMAYRLVGFSSSEMAFRKLQAKEVDLVLNNAMRAQGDFSSVAVIAQKELYLAVRKSATELLTAVDNGLEYLRIYQQPMLDAMMRKYLGLVQDPNRRLVRAGAYLEPGLTEQNQEGELEGYDVTYYRKLAQLANWELDEIPCTYKNAQRYLAEGYIDIFGSAFKTPERELIYDYPDLNTGSLFYALLTAPNSRMLPNRPDTWKDARIGILNGSKAPEVLAQFMKRYAIPWIPLSYLDIGNAERDVRQNKCDAVFSILSRGNRDLVNLTVFPTQPTYFCTNKSKPWVCEDVNKAMHKLRMTEPDFQETMIDTYSPGQRTPMVLSQDEIAYVNARKGKPITVDISPVAPVIKTYSPSLKDAHSFIKNCLHELELFSGLQFQVLPPVTTDHEIRGRLESGQAEIHFARLDETLKLDNVVYLENALMLPACGITRKNANLKDLQTVAVPKYAKAELQYFATQNRTIKLFNDRQECYRAVSHGDADYMLDCYYLAKFYLHETETHQDLELQPLDSSLFMIPFPIAFSTQNSPVLMRITEKALKSIPEVRINEMLADSLREEMRPFLPQRILFMTLGVLGIIIMVLIVFLFIHSLRKTQLQKELEHERAKSEYTQKIAEQNARLEEQQAALQQALDLANSASRAKTTFLNNMSHDIRTPMNAIIGFASLASSHLDNPERVKDYLRKIGTSSAHLLSLINDVLDMSRIESGKITLQENAENLSEIIHSLRNIVEADIRSKRLNFAMDCVNISHEEIFCDRLRLNQVLLNVLSNAIKYTPDGGSITLYIRQFPAEQPGYARYQFNINDSGIGMSQEFLKNIYEPFTRVNSSTVSGIQGTGLGMSITRNIVDLMGGKISVQSEEQKGTQVEISFTFKLADTMDTTINLPDIKGLRALVVDDNMDNCQSTSLMLHDIQVKAEWCTSGSEALVRAKEAMTINEPFDIYLVDLVMPHMNGIETIRNLRQIIGDKHPVLIVTAYDWSDVEAEARAIGITGFISKPLFPSDLSKALAACFQSNSEESDSSDSESNARPFDFQGKRVLLVEDNELNQEIAAETLSEHGLLVDTADNGRIALEIIQAKGCSYYDYILMDIQMPEMDGYQATAEIRKLPGGSKIPIIALSANAFSEDIEKSLKAGMNGHVAKPISTEILLKALRSTRAGNY